MNSMQLIKGCHWLRERREEGVASLLCFVLFFWEKRHLIKILLLFHSVDWQTDQLSFGIHWKRTRQIKNEFFLKNIRTGFFRCRFNPTDDFSRQQMLKVNWSSGQQRWESSGKRYDCLCNLTGIGPAFARCHGILFRESAEEFRLCHRNGKN